MLNYKLGYIASPLHASTKRGIKRNMKRARAYEVALNCISGSRNKAIHGYVPAVFDDKIQEEREIGLKMGLQLLDISDAIIICGNRITNGMKAELKVAINNNKLIYVFLGNPSRFKSINTLKFMMGQFSFRKIDKPEAKHILATRRVY